MNFNKHLANNYLKCVYISWDTLYTYIHTYTHTHIYMHMQVMNAFINYIKSNITNIKYEQ